MLRARWLCGACTLLRFRVCALLAWDMASVRAERPPPPPPPPRAAKPKLAAINTGGRIWRYPLGVKFCIPQGLLKIKGVELLVAFFLSTFRVLGLCHSSQKTSASDQRSVRLLYTHKQQLGISHATLSLVAIHREKKCKRETGRRRRREQNRKDGLGREGGDRQVGGWVGR